MDLLRLQIRIITFRIALRKFPNAQRLGLQRPIHCSNKLRQAPSPRPQYVTNAPCVGDQTPCIYIQRPCVGIMPLFLVPHKFIIIWQSDASVEPEVKMSLAKHSLLALNLPPTFSLS
jgi:hypothetical protein